MIEVTRRHMECTHFNSDYSRMPAVALQRFLFSQNDEVLEKAGYKATKVLKNCQRSFFRFLLVEPEAVEAVGVEAKAYEK